MMITIYEKTGTAKLSVPIADKCVHHRGIMEEEYIPVIFNYDEAIQLRNGDYIDTGYGRFEIVKLTLPEDKTASDSGYSYEQRFNPRWWRASQRKLFYNRQAGYEASWKMTHYASYFMDIVVDNMLRAGIGEFTYEIDADITGMQFVQFDGVSIIDGLTLIAEAWGVEWWFTDNVVHLGRCNYGSPVLLSMGAELADIQREESADTEYATRVFVFGSTRNIPKNYRKDLVFTVSAIQSSGNVISDTSRPLLSEWFPKALQTEVSYDTRTFDLPAKSINKEWFYAGSGTGNCAISYSSLWVGKLAPRKYVLDLSNIKISCKWKRMFSGGLAQMYVKATIKGSGGPVASYTQPVKSEMLDISTEDTEFSFNGVVLPFTITDFISATLLLEVFVISSRSDHYELACSCSAGSISLSSKDKVYHVSGLTVETIEEVPQKIEGVIFNPYYATDDSETNWLKLPDGVTLEKGTKYRISPIHLSKVDSSYFVPVVGENEVINELTDNRLAIPADNDTPYIDAWENLAEEDVVEAIVTTEKIFPRRTGTIASISTKEYTETIENEDGTTTEKKWNAYRFTDTGITFSESYIIEEELHIFFQSGKLVGKDFRVNFNPDGASEESDEAQVWEIVRNEDYGTALPTDDFGPAVGDTYILYGYDTSFVADSLVEGAEEELLEFGKEQAKKLSADKSNYRCETNVVRCAGYQEDANGVMQYNEGDVIDLDIGAAVKLVHPVYFPDVAHTSRIRSFDRSLINRYEVTYLVGEAKNYSRTGELAEKIDAIEYQSKQKESAVTSSGTNVYIIKRNDVTVVSDHNVFSALRSRFEFMCRSVAEYVRTCWTFIKGINIGSYVAGESGARIDENGNAEVGDMDVRGDANVGGKVTATDVVANQSVVSRRFTTPNFMPGGLTGSGAAVYLDPDTGLTHAEYDYIVARRGMVLSVLTIEEINSIAGGIVASKAHGEVEEISAYTADDGSTRYVIILKDVNMFQLYDLVRFARWDYTNNSYRWAWVPVRGCNTETRVINIWASDLTEGMSLPEVGDKLVLMGNTADKTRQGFVYIIDSGIQCFDGVNTASLEGKCRGVFGDLSNITDNGKTLSGYGVWTDNLYLGSQAVDTFTEIVNGVVGNLSVGGRNLLLGTNKGAERWMVHTDSTSLPTITNGNDGAVAFDYMYGNTSAQYELYSYALRPNVIEKDKNYTLTVEAYGVNIPENIYLYAEIANNDGSGKLLASTVQTETSLIESEWVRLYFTLAATNTGAVGGSQRLRLGVSEKDRGKISYIEFRNLKLEEGNVATAYTPAPEDYYNNLNAFINGDYKNQIADIQTQIDGKAQTWYQSNNPADEWTTDAEKAKHKGDLWYNTTNQKTFYWDGYSWVQQNVPTEVFDKIDGKAQIFVKQPTPPYHVGDLWVQGDGGEILKCNTTREDGYYNANDWGKASKYTDDSALESFKTEYIEYKQTVSNEFVATNQRFVSLQGEKRTLVRNILQRTNQGVNNWWQSSIFKIYETQGYGDTHYATFERVVESTDSHYELFCFDLCPELIQSGKQYLLSFEIFQHDGYSGEFTQTGGVNIRSALAAPNWTDILATTAVERNGATTQIGSWVRMEYVMNATANGKRDGNTSVYLSLTRAEYNRLALFSIKNMILIERQKKTTETITDDEFVEWRQAIEDSALDYADVVAEQAKQNAITQTKDEINIGAYAKTTYVDDKVTDLSSQINVQAGRITSEVTARETGDADLSTKIDQTASSISLKVAEKMSELGITSLNYAYGTGKPVVLEAMNNYYNQTNMLYSVAALKAGDKVVISFIIRLKNIIFDNNTAFADTVNNPNGNAPFISLQLDKTYGWAAWGIRITEDYIVNTVFEGKYNSFDEIPLDEEGYITFRHKAEIPCTIPQYVYDTDTEITPDIVGWVYMRLDYIDSEVDTDGNEIGVIEISELKIEKGDECTAWTSRTQDMYEALLDTGIDIENKRIVATADSFVVQNNLGQVTASVDEDGNLATGTVLCWNKDEATKNATPYLVTLNRNGNGYLEWYYPLPEKNASDNISIQFGWEECIDETGQDTSSIFRFFKKDGTLAWKGGDFTEFLMNMKTETVTTITPKSFHYIGAMTLADAKNKVQNILSLSANATLYLKTVQVDGKITESYYCTDSSGNNKANGGAYTLPGTPQLGLVIEGSSTTSYRRTLYSPNNGIMQLDFVEWSTSYKDRDDSIIDGGALPNQ